MSENDWWNANKNNNNKRVNLYSHPGVSEVIVRNEWKKKSRYKNYTYTKKYLSINEDLSTPSDWTINEVIFFIIIFGIFIGIILWSIN